MSTVYRGDHANLWITLQASEELGLLSSDYVQDYYGNEGQISLYHVPTDTHYPMTMMEVEEETPEIPHDVFQGAKDITLLPDGAYEIRGRVKDVVGNYTIIGEVQTPLGGEDLVTLTFTLKPGTGLIYEVPLGGAIIHTGVSGPQITLTNPTGIIARPELTE